MIPTSTGSARRILTFPAVYPCESISLVTLLNSLIRLAGDILRFKAKSISTNNRNVRETFRQIHNLAIVLDEIRTRVGSLDHLLPDSAVLSLSELHVIFQKLKFLVEDCTHDGTRLWMLMNSGQVSDNFRVLTRSISTALDTFPIRSTDLPNEVEEVIDLVVRQTRKAWVKPDPDDIRLRDAVEKIINQFENSVNPNLDYLIRILDHVGIRKWSDCSKEIKFLEEEIETVDLQTALEEKKKKTQIEFLSGLMGFMLYCRCVVFECIDKDHQDDDECNIGDFRDFVRGLNPADLRCPISLEIMSDPVVLETGHTYDRCSITQWFRSGNLTCPKTGKTLTSTELVDNVAAKQVIMSYGLQNGLALMEVGRKKTRDVRRTIEPECLAAECAGKLIADFIAGELVYGNKTEICRALREVRVLTKTSFFNRSCMVEAGVVDSILKLLRSKNSSMQGHAIIALLNLAKHAAGKSRIVENDGIGTIVEVLNEGKKTETRQQAALALFYLASVGEYSKLIGENPDSIPGLVKHLKEDNYSTSAKQNALMAIMGLLMQPDNHWRVLAAGAVPVLLDRIRSKESDELLAESMGVLAKLAEYPDGMIAVIRRGGLKLAVKILDSPDISPTAKLSCVDLLLNLCLNGGTDVLRSLAKSPLLMGSLYTVLGNGSSGGSNKASALIRMIHEFQERKPGSTEPVIARERFVHAW